MNAGKLDASYEFKDGSGNAQPEGQSLRDELTDFQRIPYAGFMRCVLQ